MSDDIPSKKELPPDQCLLVKTAEEIVDEIVAYDLPPNFKPEAWPFHDMMLASVRHEYTNYEELLWRLPTNYPLDDMPFCPCTWDYEENYYECPNATYAHDLLKWRAKDAAEAAYHDWLWTYREKK